MRDNALRYLITLDVNCIELKNLNHLKNNKRFSHFGSILEYDSFICDSYEMGL